MQETKQLYMYLDKVSYEVFFVKVRDYSNCVYRKTLSPTLFLNRGTWKLDFLSNEQDAKLKSKLSSCWQLGCLILKREYFRVAESIIRKI